MKKLTSISVFALISMFFLPISSFADGFYAGLNAGYQNGDFATVPKQNSDDIDLSGGIIGLQAGYLHNLTENLVVGVEADVQKSFSGGENTYETCIGCVDYSNVQTTEVDTPWFGTLRAVVGYEIGQFMPYVTGGVAYGVFENSTQNKYTQIYNGQVMTGSYSNKTTFSSAGYAVGGGLEYLINARFSVSAEYLHLATGIMEEESKYYHSETFADNDLFRVKVSYRF